MDLIVAREEAGQSVKTILVSRFTRYSQLHLLSLVRKGGCLLDGATVSNWGIRVAEGQNISLQIDPLAETASLPQDIPLDVIHEDQDVLVVNKPAGLLVHPTLRVKSGTLANAIAWRLNGQRFWFPHRLDQQTSGVMVIAKTATAMHMLTQAWKSARKIYFALLVGHVTQDQLAIEAPIGRRADAEPPWGVREDGKPALSHLEVVERRQQETLVRLQPVTGRTNQLRIHCAYIGHPIVGDPLYGHGGERLSLHAYELSVAGRSWSAARPWQ